MHRSDQLQLDRVLNLVRDVLASDVVGTYLFGSAVLGGLRPDSDLDVFVVSRRRTTDAEKRRLIDGLLAISGRNTPRGRWRRVELTIVVEREVRPWHYPAGFDFQYGDWLRTEFASGNLEPWPTKVNPDLATLITMVILANTTVLGQPPGEILDPVPRDDLIIAMGSCIDALLADLASDTRNVLLTLARIWATVTTGVILSKDAAAAWAIPRLPTEHRPVLDRARAIYLWCEPERWDDLEADLLPCANHMVAEIRDV
jgi:predicted nucleotidyltransferase